MATISLSDLREVENALGRLADAHALLEDMANTASNVGLNTGKEAKKIDAALDGIKLAAEIAGELVTQVELAGYWGQEITVDYT